jgi:hypothetical protein
MASFVRRLHPFKQDLIALGEPPFDPRKQSWAMGALSAVETFAGLILVVPLLVSLAAVAYWLSLSPEGRKLHHFHHVTGWDFLMVVTSTALAAPLLWAGLSLMFGWRTRYRAQGVLGFAVLIAVLIRTVLLLVL